MVSGENDGLYRTRRETFVLSLLGQAAILGLLIYLTSCLIRSTPEIARHLPKFNELPLVFSGHNGGGGGNHDPLPASGGNFPKASLDPQLAPPTVILRKEPPKLPVEETVRVAPDIRLPQGGKSAIPCRNFRECCPTDRVAQEESDPDVVVALDRQRDPDSGLGLREFIRQEKWA
jgi:hypothetical protein